MQFARRRTPKTKRATPRIQLATPQPAKRKPNGTTPPHSNRNWMPRRIPTGIAPPPLTPIRPPRMLNNIKETQRRNRQIAGPPPRTRINSFSKPCVTVKNFAHACWCNSTPSWRRGTLLAVSSSICRDVLFDSGKFTLRPSAREKLAKISGIILAYPSLALSIEGNTDSVGGDAYNQQLSENRASSVRDYLATQGIPGASMTAQGFGKTQPVAPNDTAEGRQQNRRVELVVSGEVIGNTVGAGPAAMQDLPLSPRR